MALLLRNSRGKKKSEIAQQGGGSQLDGGRVSVSARVIADEGIDPAAAAAVLGTTNVAGHGGALPPSPPDSPPADQPEEEENIYETMKRHMRAKQEELDARTAQMMQQRRAAGPGGRPGPNIPVPAVQRPAVVEPVRDLSDLPAVWNAARNFLAANAHTLESVLGGCTRVTALTTTPPEVTLIIPSTLERWTNDKARGKLEEALRAVTGLPVRLKVEFSTASIGVVTPQPGIAAAPLAAAQRIPPELMDAVKKQPIVQELMKRFDATVTQVEIAGTGEE